MALANNDTYVAVEGQIQDGVIPLSKFKTEVANANKFMGYSALGVPQAANAGMSLVGSATVSGGAVQTLTMSGLDGDAAGHYLVMGRIIVDGSSRNVGIRFNGDTGNNYNNCVIGWTGAVSGGANTGVAAIYDVFTINASANGMFWFFVDATKGRSRTAIGSGGNDGNFFKEFIGAWTNTADNLTSLSLWASAGAVIQNNSYIQVWKVA